jgi:drug/metabolite transporter (DMT)-like permease
MIVAITTSLTLVAFAANSLLCRMALGRSLIDPMSFTTLRLVSGALALFPISRLAGEFRPVRKIKDTWGSALSLFVYAASFSFAYVSIGAGVGALILFGSVQVTMIGAALISGEKLELGQWAGSIAAIGGLVYLVLPGISSPDPLGALLMCVSGIAWGIYSIRGKGASAPVAITAGNFLRSAPMAIIGSALLHSSIHMEPFGILLALISGIVTSGLGYTFWYKALRNLKTTHASVVQLLVPVIAAFGGVTLLSERLSLRLAFASALILGGVTAVILKRGKKPNRKPV